MVPGKAGRGFFPQQLLLQLLEGQMQIPRPLRRQPDAVELILAVPGKDGHPAGGNHQHAVLGAEAQGCRVPPEHDAPQGPLPVLQGKVVVARGVALVVGQLPPHQEAGQQPVPVHEALNILPHLTGREDGLLAS